MPAIVAAAFAWIARSWFGKMVLEFLLGRLMDFLKVKIEERKRRLEIEKQARESVEKLKNAKDGKGIDDSVDSALDGT